MFFGDYAMLPYPSAHSLGKRAVLGGGGQHFTFFAVIKCR
jgi:hypothetical protein